MEVPNPRPHQHHPPLPDGIASRVGQLKRDLSSLPPSSGRSARIADLCNTDKQKVATLVQQIVKLGKEKEDLQRVVEQQEAAADARLAKLRAQNERITLEVVTLRHKFSQALILLRAYQHRLQEMPVDSRPSDTSIAGQVDALEPSEGPQGETAAPPPASEPAPLAPPPATAPVPFETAPSPPPPEAPALSTVTLSHPPTPPRHDAEALPAPLHGEVPPSLPSPESIVTTTVANILPMPPQLPPPAAAPAPPPTFTTASSGSDSDDGVVVWGAADGASDAGQGDSRLLHSFVTRSGGSTNGDTSDEPSDDNDSFGPVSSASEEEGDGEAGGGEAGGSYAGGGDAGGDVADPNETFGSPELDELLGVEPSVVAAHRRRLDQHLLRLNAHGDATTDEDAHDAGSSAGGSITSSVISSVPRADGSFSMSLFQPSLLSLIVDIEGGGVIGEEAPPEVEWKAPAPPSPPPPQAVPPPALPPHQRPFDDDAAFVGRLLNSDGIAEVVGPRGSSPPPASPPNLSDFDAALVQQFLESGR